jgi:2-polyprenyl-3-methyl-5-hydroxy-6-metoxy-1,4-benzoquinol methylase
MNSSEIDSLSKLFKQEIASLHHRIETLDVFIKEEVNNRLLTIEWLVNNNQHKLDYALTCSDFLYKKAKLNQPEIVQFLDAIPKYSLSCSQTIAIDSNDNIEPESTFEGDVSRVEFVHACERITSKDKLKFLDVGCGSGALVFDFISCGHFAVGVDGSDACKAKGLGYWNIIKHLHNCDITTKFSFLGNDARNISFDIISMWEVFEHIPKNLCGQVLDNIRHQLSDNGLFVGSISQLEYVNAVTGTPYHVTLESKEWWRDLFHEHGLEMIKSEFKDNEYYRGVGNRYQDIHSYKENPETGFHFVARLIKEDDLIA